MTKTRNVFLSFLGWTLLTLGCLLMATAIFGLYGCGTADPAPNEKFINVWTTQSGTGTYVCDDGSAGGLQATPGYTIEILGGETDETLVVDLTKDCRLSGFSVEHGVAANAQNSPCTYTRQDPAYGRVETHVTQRAGTQYTVDDMSLSEDGVRDYQFHYIDYPGGFILNCTLTYKINYTTDS